jgi:hypothetical protein
MRQQIQQTNTRTEYFKFVGGLDLVTPHLSIAPGSALDATNYEPGLYGGYGRIKGFERYDGHPAPSDANYWTLAVNGTSGITVGNTVTGQTSGASGIVTFIATRELVLANVTGTFSSGENIQVASVTKCQSTRISIMSGADTDVLDITYRNLSADIARNAINAVPGSGPVRGVWVYNDVSYAFRNNAGGTAGKMYQSTGSGWTEIALGRELQFNTGVSQINDNDTVTGGTSSASGVVKRVVLQTGSWGTTAAGYLVFASVTGTFINGELIKIGGTTKATAIGADSAITLPPGGRYEFVNHNFTGSSDTLKMYGANGVGNAFEFDGTTFVRIRTGMTIDTPHLITVHRMHLFLAYNGSLQHSLPGYPYQWSVVLGAGELGLGDKITGLLPQSSSSTSAAMLCMTRHSCQILNGTSVANWVLTPYMQDIGGLPYTGQQIGSAIFMDDRGMMKLDTSKNYGNFEQSTISRPIQPLIDTKRGMLTGSCVVRTKNQYRAFCNDGTGIIMSLTTGYSSLGAQTFGYQFTTFDYQKTVRAICSCTKTDGSEIILFGSDDGYVYQAEKGNTFDGNIINAWLRMPFHHTKSPRIRKRYRKAIFEITALTTSTLRVNAEYGYGNQDISTAPPLYVETTGLGAYWDTVNWDEFTYEAQIVNNVEVGLSGTANNISLLIFSGAKEPAHTLHGVILHFTPRRLSR